MDRLDIHITPQMDLKNIMLVERKVKNRMTLSFTSIKSIDKNADFL